MIKQLSVKGISFLLTTFLVIGLIAFIPDNANAASKKKTVYLPTSIKIVTTQKDYVKGKLSHDWPASPSSYAYSYNKKGLMTKAVYKWKFDGKNESTVNNYTRHKSGAIQSRKYIFKGQLGTKVKNTINKKGQVTKSNITMYSDGKFYTKRTRTFKYHKNGNIKESVTKEKEYGKMTTTTRTYSKSGDIVKSVYKSGTSVDTTKWTYNKHGDVKKVVKTSKYDSNSGLNTTITTYKYKYNKKGNYTSRTEITTGKYSDGTAKKKDVSKDTFSYKYDKKGNIIKMKTYYEIVNIPDGESHDAAITSKMSSTYTIKYKKMKINKKHLIYHKGDLDEIESDIPLNF